MIGGGLGGWQRGEWPDDTQMGLCILQETATGRLDPLAVAAPPLGCEAKRTPDGTATWRTPAVPAAYLAHRQQIGASEAWARVRAELPAARVNPSFRSALERLWPAR